MPGLENWIKRRQGLGATSSETSEVSLEAHNTLLDEQPLVENPISEAIEANPLWNVLVETVESEILFPNRLAYVRQKIIKNKQHITPEELTERTGFPLGVSMVILSRLRKKK